MTMLTLYSLIAVFTLSIALAAKTKTLWRVGGLFALNWATLILISTNMLPEAMATPSALASLYVVNTLLNFKFYLKHRCSAGLAIAALQMISVMFYGYSQAPLNSVSINFLLSALIIVSVSLSQVVPVELDNHRGRVKTKTSKDGEHIKVGH